MPVTAEFRKRRQENQKSKIIFSCEHRLGPVCATGNVQTNVRTVAFMSGQLGTAGGWPPVFVSDREGFQ